MQTRQTSYSRVLPAIVVSVWLSCEDCGRPVASTAAHVWRDRHGTEHVTHRPKNACPGCHKRP